MKKICSMCMTFVLFLIGSLVPVSVQHGEPVGTTEECLVQLCTENAKFDGNWEWQAAGMAYILRTSMNRLIIIDGGENEADAVHIIEKAKELTGEETPTVALWIITHPHMDHYGALWMLSRNEHYRNQLRIESICYQQFAQAVLPLTGKSYHDGAERINETVQNLGVPIRRPHTDQTWDFDGMKIRFLFTPEDCYDKLGDVNELSLIFQVIGQKKTAMFTGDAYAYGAQRCAVRYRYTLRSDYCQLAHHGLNGGANAFYACVNAKTVLIPGCIAGERDVAAWKPGSCPRQYAERWAKEVYRSYQGDLVFPL